MSTVGKFNKTEMRKCRRWKLCDGNGIACFLFIIQELLFFLSAYRITNENMRKKNPPAIVMRQWILLWTLPKFFFHFSLRILWTELIRFDTFVIQHDEFKVFGKTLLLLVTLWKCCYCLLLVGIEASICGLCRFFGKKIKQKCPKIKRDAICKAYSHGKMAKVIISAQQPNIRYV